MRHSGQLGVSFAAPSSARQSTISATHPLSDLLQIARRAVENVEPKRVTVADIEKAGRFLGGRRLSSLRPEDLPRAAELHQTHRILDTEQDRRMLRTSCVLAYDGTEWWDVHPAIRAIDLFQQALKARGP